MKLQSCLMIRCIALNTIDTQDLLIKLKQSIGSDYSNIEISLYANTPYWKYPECNEIIYNISYTESILIANLIKLFCLSWHYSESDVFDVDIQQTVHQETAIWNKNCHPTEQFLMPEIEWVHIYTWKNRNESIIN